MIEDPDWALLKQAFGILGQSTCVRRKIGAVLYNPFLGFAISSWNVEKQGRRCDQGDCPRGLKSLADKAPNEPPYDDCIATHAEAVVWETYPKRGTNLRGLTLYVTAEPCPECMEVLEQYPGLRVVVMVAREFTIGKEG